MNPIIQLPQEAIKSFCQKWEIQRLELFGSALRSDFRPESDLDFLVTFHAENRWSLFDLVSMEEELTKIVGRKVDLVSRRGIEHSRNALRRKTILESAEVYYAA